MKTTLIMALMIASVGLIYQAMIIQEQRSDVRVNKELYKACSAELMWIEAKLMQ